MFAAVSVAGCVGGSYLWETTTGILPDPIAAGIGVGVWVGTSWAGGKLAYRDPLDRVLDSVGGLGG
jgi:hypothetical protein